MLTDRKIQAALKTCKSETVLNDKAGGRGTGSLVLVIRCGANGVTANWAGQWWVDGKRQRRQLGRYPDMSLADAREQYAQLVRGALATGVSPKVTVPVQQTTIAVLFEAYCDRMVADGKSSATEVRRCLKLAAKDLGANRLAGSITPADVSAYLAKVYQRGAKVAADRIRAYLSAAFNWAIKATHDYREEHRRDWGVSSNPVEAVQRDADASKPRDRVLTEGELRALWAATAGPGWAPETRAAIRLMIVLGQRARETLRMDVAELDLDGAVWTIPAPKTKVGKFAHPVPLPPLAMAIIRELLQVRRTGLLMPIDDHALTKAVERYLKRTKAPRWQLRDLRRTWKSLAAAAGVDRFTRDLIQQHAMNDTGSRHYDRADYLPQKRAALKLWSDYLEKILETPETRLRLCSPAVSQDALPAETASSATA